MSEKTFNSRIVLKHDSEANWNKATGFIPKLGEMIIYEPNEEHEEPRVKIGDGVNIVSNLPFIKDGDFGLSKKTGWSLKEHSISEANILATSDIVAKQSGENDPSPENVRPIVGWDTLSLIRTNRNLISHFNAKFTQGHTNAIVTAEYVDVTTPTAFDYQRYDNIPLKAGQPYTLVVDCEVYGRDEADTRNTTVAYRIVANDTQSQQTQITANGKYRFIRNYTPKEDILSNIIWNPNYGNATSNGKVPSKSRSSVMLLEGTYTKDTAPSFIPCDREEITVLLPETVYGGTYDWKTGLLTVTHIYQELTGNEAWEVNADNTMYAFDNRGIQNKAITDNQKAYHLCSHYKPASYKDSNTQADMTSATLNSYKMVIKDTTAGTLDGFKAYLSAQAAAGTPVTFVFPLKSTYYTTIQLSPQTIKATEGYNAVWSNCGSTTAVFNWCQNEVTNYLGTETVGSLTNPIYLNEGKPEACSYELNATVPSDAKFTDTTYSAATTSKEGLMSTADKKALEAYKCYNLGGFSGKTIADLRSSLETWASSVINYPGATACFSSSPAWITLWNAEDLTSTIGEGPVWTVTLETYYVREAYLLIKVTSYYDKKVYYIARENDIWKAVQTVAFSGESITSSQLPTSGVTAGTYGLDAAASPAHGGKFMVPKIVVDDKGRITSAAEYEITLPADTNTDTGATSVTVTGSGNAVTTASYDADTRKLTLTKGATYNNYSHPTGNAPSKASGLYKFSTDATSHVNSVTAVTKADITALGIPELDNAGKIPSSQLPSYVDDVLEYSAKSSFPATGETGKIYIDTSTNKTYRWSGSTYTEISASLALGETSSTAYYGDKGAAAYAHAVTNKGVAKTSGLYKITTNSEGHVTAGTAVTKSDITALGIPAQDTTYSAATTSAAGLMSVADKKLITALTADAITFEKTVAGLRTALESWATSSYYKPGAMGQFVCGADWMNTWNAEDLTTTLTGGIRWLVTLESYYTSSDYLLLKFTNYGSKRVYYAARTGSSGWGAVSQVFFNDSTLKATQLPASGVNAGTYGPEAAAAPEPGEKILIPKVVVDDKGRITSAATYEITLPADTDTKVNVTLGTTTKAYLLGVSQTPTGTATGRTAIADTGVYLDTVAGRLRSTSVSTDTLVSATGTAMYIKPGSTLYIQSAASTSLIFQPQGTERARFDTNGNFLIKTTLQPGTDNTYNLGTDSYKWKNIYATTYHGGTATTSAEGLMSAADKVKVDAALVLQSTRITDSISLDDTAFAAGIYVVDGFTLDDVKYYGTFIQYGGSYHTQVLYVSPSGAQGKMVIYTRRYVSGSSSWSPWIKIDSVIKEASLKWGGQALAGEVSPVDAAMSSIHGANRFAFADPSGITVEYSNDAGSTWNSYTTTDAQKVRLVSGIGSSYQIGGPDKTVGTHTVNDQLRISLVAKNMGVYTSLQKILLNINPYLATGCKVKVEHSTYGAQTTFVTDGTYDIGGTSAQNWNSIPFGGVKFGSTSSSNWYMIRLTFSVTAVSSSTTSSSGLTISDVVGHGPTYWTTPSSMAKTGHLYTYDENQAAIFAGSITVKNTSMYINGETAESVANAGFQLQHGGNSIGKLFCSKAGTTSQGGNCQLVLGNTKSSTSNYNARGSIMMYSEAATGVTLLAHTINTNYYYYFRDHDQAVYSVGTTTRNAVGSASVPVYINNKGIVTACTLDSTYLKLSGGSLNGEVTSSVNVTASNAAFRNIKAVPSTTEIVAGTTAIPTGEIWVRYE